MGKWNSTPSPLWKLNPSSIEEVLQAYQAGERIKDICLRFGITLNAIRYHARKAGIWQGKRPGPPLAIRFWNKVHKTETCWNWTGAKFTNGYGCFHVDGQSVGAHRVSYEFSNGPIPLDLVIDHLCRNRICVRPDHLEAVTSVINVKRGKDFLGIKYALKRSG